MTSLGLAPACRLLANVEIYLSTYFIFIWTEVIVLDEHFKSSHNDHWLLNQIETSLHRDSDRICNQGKRRIIVQFIDFLTKFVINTPSRHVPAGFWPFATCFCAVWGKKRLQKHSFENLRVMSWGCFSSSSHGLWVGPTERWRKYQKIFNELKQYWKEEWYKIPSQQRERLKIIMRLTTSGESTSYWVRGEVTTFILLSFLLDK